MRPKDLPQPVRPHKPHESLSEKVWRSPGPCAYVGEGVTSFSKSCVGGFLGKSARFRETTASAAAHIGPQSPPPLKSSKLPITFGAPGRPCKGASAPEPGPGSYDPREIPSTSTISFTRGKRLSLGRNGGTPGPDAYDSVLRKRVRGVVFGTACSNSSTPRQGGHEITAEAPGPEELDRAMKLIRPNVSAVISFPKAPRGSGPGDSIGPAQYNPSDHIVKPNTHGGKFGASRSRMNEPSLTTKGVPYCTPGSFEIQSTKCHSTAVVFTKAPQRPQTALQALRNSTESLYLPSYKQVDKDEKVVPWKLCSRQKNAFGGLPVTAAVPFVDPKSTLDGPSIGFTRGKRPTLAVPTASPGPAHYGPAPQPRPESASGKSFGRSPRSTSDHPKDSSPGPQYDPKIDVVAPSSFTTTFGKEKRDRPASADASPGAGFYSPQYGHVERNPHAAILYLTG